MLIEEIPSNWKQRWSFWKASFRFVCAAKGDLSVSLAALLRKTRISFYTETCSSVLSVFRNVQHVHKSVAIVWPVSVKKGFWEKVEASRILHSNHIARTVPTRSICSSFSMGGRWFLAMKLFSKAEPVLLKRKQTSTWSMFLAWRMPTECCWAINGSRPANAKLPLPHRHSSITRPCSAAACILSTWPNTSNHVCLGSVIRSFQHNSVQTRRHLWLAVVARLDVQRSHSCGNVLVHWRWIPGDFSCSEANPTETHCC